MGDAPAGVAPTQPTDGLLLFRAKTEECHAIKYGSTGRQGRDQHHRACAASVRRKARRPSSKPGGASVLLGPKIGARTPSSDGRLRFDVGPCGRSRQGHASGLFASGAIHAGRQRARTKRPRCRPHWLRHAHGSHALDRGASLAEVQSTLGHANVATTSGYLHARPDSSSGLYLDEGIFR